jgi:hypothetical protein
MDIARRPSAMVVLGPDPRISRGTYGSGEKGALH